MGVAVAVAVAVATAVAVAVVVAVESEAAVAGAIAASGCVVTWSATCPCVEVASGGVDGLLLAASAMPMQEHIARITTSAPHPIPTWNGRDAAR